METRLKNTKIILTLKIIVGLIVLYRLFSLDIYAVVPHDAVRYIREAVANTYISEPNQLVQIRGFKFPGYPLYLSIVYKISSLLPIDGMTLMALSQRLLLGIGLIWLLFDLGLFAIPLVLFFSSNIFLAQSNILYTEGLSIPMAILFSISLVKIYRIRNREKVLLSFKFWSLFILLTTSFVFLVLTKLTHMAFLLPILILAFTVEHKGFRLKITRTKIACATLVLVAVASVYVLAVSFDNKRQFNKFTPVMGHERLLYFGLWTQLFYLTPENKLRPELAEFYDNGSAYNFLLAVDKECGGKFEFFCTAPIHRKRTGELLQKSGMSLPVERIRSFATGIIGGSKSELYEWRHNILQANGGPYRLEARHSNWYTNQYGIKKYLDTFNRGVTPQVFRGLSNSRKSVWKIREVQAIMTILAMLAFGWAILKRKTDFHTPYVYATISYLVFITALASGLMDLWRFIIPSWSIFIIILSYGIADFINES